MMQLRTVLIISRPRSYAVRTILCEIKSIFVKQFCKIIYSLKLDFKRSVGHFSHEEICFDFDDRKVRNRIRKWFRETHPWNYSNGYLVVTKVEGHRWPTSSEREVQVGRHCCEAIIPRVGHQRCQEDCTSESGEELFKNRYKQRFRVMIHVSLSL